MGAYYNVIKTDPEKLEKERQRVKSILNNRYKEDEAYHKRCKEYSKLYRLKKKLEKENLKTQNDIKN